MSWVLPNTFTHHCLDLWIHHMFLFLGHYAYIESSYRQKGDTAHLVSGVMSRARCMEFMFNLHGVYMGEINVFQQHQDGRRPKRLMTKAGNHERHWHKAWVNIPDVGGPYKVRNYIPQFWFVNFRSGSRLKKWVGRLMFGHASIGKKLKAWFYKKISILLSADDRGFCLVTPTV